MVVSENRIPHAAPRSVQQNAPWKFIAVMGVTGSGKSTFIRKVSGDSSVLVGDGLYSCTSELKSYAFNYGGFNINLVDSPGFNDTHRSETDVLQDIASWLRETYEGETKLTGIVYLHGINHSRMEGSALRNLKMFRELCGNDPLQNVVLATTFWDTVQAEAGARRETELKDTFEFWGGMIKRGSRMARAGTTEECYAIVSDLLNRSPKALRIQHELVEEAVPLAETAAGQVVSEELIRLENKHKQEKEEMQRQMQEALEQPDWRQEIIQEQEKKVSDELLKVKRQQEQLKADRRSDLRRQQIEFDDVIAALRKDNARLKRKLAGSNLEKQWERAQFNQRLEDFERYNQDMWQRWNLSVDEIIAKVRVEESKLRVEDREELEHEINQLKESLAEGSRDDKGSWKPRAKKAGAHFLKILRVLLPLTSLVALGLPGHS
ncbi:hypothetical protein HII31_08862 [Pseudocercospora fuligena]|uniref:G domain-containing protein n=1 Tax=Pseudocercospora fuligena TaxID=685502 RepID=A0A8H6VK69_9PEZI|nr:hypothetical protein HII31_08862 [Pseudocercospora fuligena]